MELPHQTHEGRTITALHIGKLDEGYRTGVLFTAGMHAREWGGSDCGVNFAADLLEKYTAGAGLRYGNTEFDATQIAGIVETMEVFVVGCVNPDGRTYSQSQDPKWRKNRAPIPDSDELGTDVNRNFDFLWTSHARSTVPCSTSHRWAAPIRPRTPTTGRGGPRSPRRATSSGCSTRTLRSSGCSTSTATPVTSCTAGVTRGTRTPGPR